MPITVMIVDDSKLARIVAGKALTELQPDWQRVEAGSAAQALEIVGAQQIDVALIDFNMTEMDGLQLARELRANHPDLPMAIITANIQDEIIASARAINASFVPKPVTAEALQPSEPSAPVQNEANASEASAKPQAQQGLYQQIEHYRERADVERDLQAAYLQAKLPATGLIEQLNAMIQEAEAADRLEEDAQDTPKSAA